MLSDHYSSPQPSQYTPNDSTLASSDQLQYGNNFFVRKKDEKTAVEHQENVPNDGKYTINAIQLLFAHQVNSIYGSTSTLSIQ
jgi:hypothetical protein